MEFTKLFPEVPEDLSALGDEQLRDRLREMGAVSEKLKGADAETFLTEQFGAEISKADRDAEAIRQWREAGENAVRIKAQLEENRAAEAETAQAAEELHAQFAIEDEPKADEAAAEPVADADESLAAKADDDEEDEPKKDDEEDEPSTEAAADSEDVPAAEVVTASAAPARAPRFAVPRSHTPLEEAEAQARAVLVASAGTSVGEGRELDRLAFAQALIERARHLGPVRKGASNWRDGVVYPVASARFPFPDEFVLGADKVENLEKIKAIGSPWFQDSLQNFGRYVRQADGGICAPPTPFYDLPEFSTTRRPVRDNLPSFQAVRGGVSIPSVSSLADASGAITVITADDDAQGGTFATKSCIDMDCATWTETFVDTISHCRSYGNLNAMTWPEGVAHENSNTMAIFARIAEGRLLEKMDALLLNLTANVAYGASSTLLYALQISRAGIISRLRMDEDTRFQVFLPFWVKAMFSADIVNGQYDRFDVTPEDVPGLFARFGFDPTFHLDESTAAGATEEIWNDEVTSTLQNDWPGSTVIARLFPRNHLLHLDTGQLDFGITRDIDHNAQNVYAVQGEIFESLAAVGPTQAGHRLAITVCPDGRVAAPETTELTCQTS